MSIAIAVIGAGPYGLSIAAHLAATHLTFRIFGSPMESWSRHMPKGMHLKSEGFASDLYDPERRFTLRHYCEEMHLPYAKTGLPVPLETFVAYGIAFQKRFVPMLEQTEIVLVNRVEGGFEMRTCEGEIVRASHVIVATGITHFGFLPTFLAGLPHELVTHSSEHHELGKFKGKRVIVVGAGASALDIAALLHEAGAKVELVARRERIAFQTLGKDRRSLWQRMRNPRSGLGIGWRSLLCTNAPLLFRLMPHRFRFRVTRNHLGPAPGWFVRERTEGKFPFHLGARIEDVSVENSEVHMNLVKDGRPVEVIADHLIAATGYRASVSRLTFLASELRRKIETIEDTPVLTSNFESSAPGLYMVGVVSANSFGPMARFAFGARFTARRITSHLARKAWNMKAGLTQTRKSAMQSAS